MSKSRKRDLKSKAKQNVRAYDDDDPDLAFLTNRDDQLFVPLALRVSPEKQEQFIIKYLKFLNKSHSWVKQRL